MSPIDYSVEDWTRDSRLLVKPRARSTMNNYQFLVYQDQLLKLIFVQIGRRCAITTMPVCFVHGAESHLISSQVEDERENTW